MSSIKFDTLVIELQNSGKSVGSVSIKKTDLDMLMNLHGHTREFIINDMINAIENKDSVQQEQKADSNN
jgi:hypothetical protein